MPSLTSLTLAELAAGYRTGTLDPRDITAAYLEAIEAPKSGAQCLYRSPRRQRPSGG